MFFETINYRGFDRLPRKVASSILAESLVHSYIQDKARGLRMKSFIPNLQNNVWTVDANGITPILKCSDTQECFYMCDKLNEGENDARMANNHNNSARSRA